MDTHIAGSRLGFTNFKYAFSVRGSLKVLQFIVGLIVLSIQSYFFDHYYSQFILTYGGAGVYLLLIVTTCTITTLLLLISNLSSLATSTMLPKTVFEYLYHFVAALLKLTAGVSLMIKLPKGAPGYDAQMTASAMTLINAGLYLASGVLAYITFKSS